MIEFAIIAIGAILPLGIYFLTDNIKTSYYLKKNQREWDIFSQGMTEEEKRDVFIDWLYAQKRKNGTRFLYIPRM